MMAMIGIAGSAIEKEKSYSALNVQEFSTKDVLVSLLLMCKENLCVQFARWLD